ncbi:hypothetical protein RCO48_29430 [Peribacillus frigoritolerans]|nr:hypothetical protein [Peribacillus frigoritolerans]
MKQEAIKNPEETPTNEEQTKKETRERQDTPDRETRSSVKTGFGNMEGFLKWTAITLSGALIFRFYRLFPQKEVDSSSADFFVIERKPVLISRQLI